jgi:hypothetical protein
MARSSLKKWRRVCVGFSGACALVLGIAVAPVLLKAADPSPIIGNWEGTLDPGAQAKKRIVVHIAAAQDGSLNGTVDYPDEQASGDAITAITYKEPALHFECGSSLAVYDGTLSKDNSQLTGTWKQGGAPVSLVLKRTP